MGRHQNKPWQKRWVPQPGPKGQRPAFTAPEVPEGFERVERGDWNSYTTATPFTYGWTITGRAGVKWRVFEEIPPGNPDWSYGAPRKHTELRFESQSFEACVMFVRVEMSNEEEKPKTRTGWDFGGSFMGRAASVLKQGEFVQQIAKAQLDAYRSKFPDITAVWHDELIHDCRDSAQAGTAIHEALAALDFSELEAYCIADAEATRNAKS